MDALSKTQQIVESAATVNAVLARTVPDASQTKGGRTASKMTHATRNCVQRRRGLLLRGGGGPKRASKSIVMFFFVPLKKK